MRFCYEGIIDSAKCFFKFSPEQDGAFYLEFANQKHWFHLQIAKQKYFWCWHMVG
jgi:hypothetical protein